MKRLNMAWQIDQVNVDKLNELCEKLSFPTYEFYTVHNNGEIEFIWVDMPELGLGEEFYLRIAFKHGMFMAYHTNRLGEDTFISWSEFNEEKLVDLLTKALL